MDYQVVWRGIIHDKQGYARASREYLLALDKQGVDVRVEPLNFGTVPTVLLPEQAKRIRELMAKPLATDKKKILVYHAQPYGIDPVAERQNGFDKVIINTVWETTRVPQEWFPAINKADGVIVPSKQNVQALKDSGVTVPIYLVPHGAEVDMFNPDNEPFTGVDSALGDTFTFLSVFQWQHRKAPDVLLKAYWQEFSAKDNVSLIVKSYWNPNDKQTIRMVHSQMAEYKDALGFGDDRAPLFYSGSDFNETDLQGLYTRSNIFVLPTRGEGVGLPYIEAMCSGIPCIATGWGGQADFITNDNGFLLNYELESVDSKKHEAIADHQFAYFKPYMQWAEPNVEHLRLIMRHAYENQDIVKAKGEKAREDMKQMTWNKSGEILKEMMEKAVL
jgi:glycosyltransferase involved in cell wall biosynthesis